MKISVQHIISILLFATASGLPLLADAQHSSQAVMEVTAKVINGVQSEIPGYTDLTGRITGEENEEFTLGEYGIRLPEGTDFLISFAPDITLKGKDTSWTIHTDMKNQIETDGTITLSFNGISSANGVEPGQYRGKQTIRIEYY
jgi:hypothetical protein